MSRHVAKIPEDSQQGSVYWLTIIPDESSTGAVFLCEHETLNKPHVFDTWCESVSVALECAKERWGIPEDAWQVEGV